MISVIISHIIMAGCLRPRLAKYWPTISLGLPGLGNTPSTGQYWVILGNMTSDWLSSVKSQWIFTILQFKIQFNKFSKLQKHYYNSDISKFMTPNFDRIKDLWNHEILIHFEILKCHYGSLSNKTCSISALLYFPHYSVSLMLREWFVYQH